MSETVDGFQAEIDKTNEKQQNDLLARREARRRKILENAKSRLDRLSGTEKDESSTNKCKNHLPEETYPDPEIRHPEYVSVNSYNHTYTATTPNHFDNDLGPSLLNSPVVVPPTRFEQLLQTRLHIIASSILSYVLLNITILSSIFSHSLFVLFLTIECLELAFFRQDKPLSPIVNMILLLSGLNMSKTGALLKLFGLLNRMLCDLGLFVFSFVVCHAVCGVFTDATVPEAFNSF